MYVFVEWPVSIIIFFYLFILPGTTYPLPSVCTICEDLPSFFAFEFFFLPLFFFCSVCIYSCFLCCPLPHLHFYFFCSFLFFFLWLYCFYYLFIIFFFPTPYAVGGLLCRSLVGMAASAPPIRLFS
ncbi:hypothetical protein TCDM_04391 [Trypanosoma cruzi Dm28c]|uniref:Uncharacterized protein n=1 Tax=Trypanosoma cruzi Dm28c TaxID=1416333 RepID=V5DHH4_TRYCR|nr:hypothetical protein TCDM_04391 [Trypanosoma cruzi Dm28c]